MAKKKDLRCKKCKKSTTHKKSSWTEFVDDMGGGWGLAGRLQDMNPARKVVYGDIYKCKTCKTFRSETGVPIE
jgi:hypothetical protein